MSLAGPSRARPAGADAGRLIARAREHCVEFDPYLANHLPMVLAILDRLGASPARQEQWFETYERVSRLQPAPADQRRIDGASWRSHLGDRAYEGDYRGFFAREVDRLGVDAALRLYLPQLLPGIAASALHALMRLAYARLRGDPLEVATALGYWATTFLPLRQAGVAKPLTSDPGELLAALREIPALRHLQPPSDLLWHWMREAAAHPDFPPVADLLAPAPDLLRRVARTSLALMAATMSFEAVHAVTGAHWVRLLRLPPAEEVSAARYLWQALAAVYPKMGMPLPQAAQALDKHRRLPAPAWPEIAEHAVASDDEHDLSFTFSAMDEERAYGDGLYRVLAARRLGLIG
jgi:Questin oxidase-like